MLIGCELSVGVTAKFWLYPMVVVTLLDIELELTSVELASLVRPPIADVDEDSGAEE